MGLRVGDATNPAVSGHVTNNHVAAARGSQLCPNAASIGATEYAPGEADNNCKTASEIGKLKRFVSVVFSATTFNRVDAAFVQSSGSGTDERTACGLCFPPTAIVSTITALGTTVRKCGRTTQLTSVGLMKKTLLSEG